MENGRYLGVGLGWAELDFAKPKSALPKKLKSKSDL